ncbi:MAG: c-type cytochrome [Motiliproteus sp.]
MSLLLAGVFSTFSVPAVSAAAEQSRHELGRQLYNYRCYYCHGYSGDAKTLATTYMTPQPRDFNATGLADLSRQRMVEVVTQGSPKTAMTSFTQYLSAEEIQVVVDFVRLEFMQNKRQNTRYHTLENGWPDHERYRPAYAFATGELALDSAPEQLSVAQRQGLQLFLKTCISCHDRARVMDEGPIWESRAISYPRNNFSYTNFDVMTSASVYADHDRIPQLGPLSASQKQGEQLFQDNCAFCHGADGTGKNWIGSFLDVHPRDLTDSGFMSRVDQTWLKTIIREGVDGTSMPAWKSVLDEAQLEALVNYISLAFYPVADGVVDVSRSQP